LARHTDVERNVAQALDAANDGLRAQQLDKFAGHVLVFNQRRRPFRVGGGTGRDSGFQHGFDFRGRFRPALRHFGRLHQVAFGAGQRHGVAGERGALRQRAFNADNGVVAELGAAGGLVDHARFHRLGSGRGGFLQGAQAFQVAIDGRQLAFQGVVFFRLGGVQGAAFLGRLGHDFFQSRGLGLAGFVELLDLFLQIHIFLAFGGFS